MIIHSGKNLLLVSISAITVCYLTEHYQSGGSDRIWSIFQRNFIKRKFVSFCNLNVRVANFDECLSLQSITLHKECKLIECLRCKKANFKFNVLTMKQFSASICPFVSSLHCLILHVILCKGSQTYRVRHKFCDNFSKCSHEAEIKTYKYKFYLFSSMLTST